MCVEMSRLPALASVLTILTLSSVAWADGVPITPGLWEIKTHNSMLGTEEVDQQCMRDDVFDPVAVLGEEDGCEISNEKVAGNTVDYDLACIDDQQRGSATGHFSFTIDGDQGNGNVDMTFSLGDETMNMQYTMAAVRIGDC